MNESASLFCGCRYIKPGTMWYQVVACPDHVLATEPHAEVPEPKERK